MLFKNLIFNFALLVFFAFPAMAQVPINELGTPGIQNFKTQELKAHGQNWNALQDQRGVMYFANTNGILEYDGVHWNLIDMPHHALTRGLAISPNGTIYYGSNGDIGYLAADGIGKTKAVSLLALIPVTERAFNDVWQVASTRDGIYFLTKEKIFRLFKGKISILDGRFSNSQALVINRNLVFVDRDRGLSLIQGDKILSLPEFAGVANGGRISLAQSGEHEIIVVRTSGDLLKLNFAPLWDRDMQYYMSRSNLDTPLWQTLPSELNRFVQNDRSSAYRMFRVSPDTFALATLKAGLIIFDVNGKFIRSISKTNGLIDNTVTFIYVDANKNLWVPTNAGISYVEYSRPISTFGEANGLDGTILSVIKHRNKLYAGSFQQILVQAPFQFSDSQLLPQFVPVKNGTDASWEMLEVDGDLLAATYSGLVKIQDETVFKVPKSPTSGYCLGSSKKWPHHVFMGTMGGVSVFKSENGMWQFIGTIPKITGNVRRIATDENGDLWLSTEANGLYFMQLSTDSPLKVILSPFGAEDGLPSLLDNQINLFKGQLVATTPKGVFRASKAKLASGESSYRFTPDPDFSPLMNDPPTSINSLISDGRNGILFSSEKSITWLTKDTPGEYQVKMGVFQGTPRIDTPLYLDPMGTVWLSHLGLSRIDPWSDKNFQQGFDALVRKVTTSNKRSVFEGNYTNKDEDTQDNSIFVSMPSKKQPLELNYIDNGLTFDFSASYFEKPKDLQFRFKLDGFDDHWSDWNTVTTKEYTNIPFGSYAFRVQARNLYGVIGNEASYAFKIKAPWYFTVWAIILWVFLAGGSIFLGVRLYTKKLQNEKRNLEALVAVRTKELHEASLTDPLTGLRNRRFITEILQTDTSAFVKYKNYLLDSKNKRQNSLSDEVFGVYLLDLDHFKQVNDTYGHDGGDRILKQFSHILTASVREDDVVIRLGGEEFLIVLKKARVGFLSVFADKLLEKVANSDFEVADGITIRKTCSIGYACYPFDPENPETPSFEQVISLADMGMYYAKGHGRNRACSIEKGPHWARGIAEIGKLVTSLDYGLEKHYLKVD